MDDDTPPQFLFDAYRQYKFDTGIFVSWLGETATKCGFTGHIVGSSSSKAKPKNSKKPGKNKKPPPKSVVPLSQFPALAGAIAKSDIEVPSSIVLVLKHLIRARAECADWFCGREGDEEHLESKYDKPRSILPSPF